MITLFQFPPGHGMTMSVSPFCGKVEMYLRLTGREFTTEFGNLFKSPNRAMPYVRWPDGELSAESDEIIARLESEGPALDDGLDDDTKSRGQDLTALVEHDLYYSCLYQRFVPAEGWAFQREAVRPLLPRLLFPVLAPIVRRSQRKKCKKGGVASVEDCAKGVTVVRALSDALGDSDYILGDTVRVADSAVGPVLINAASTPTETETRETIRGDERLSAYLNRLAERAELPFRV